MKAEILGMLAIGLFTGPMAAEATYSCVNITVDNSYAMFSGTGTQATTFVGSNCSWPDTGTCNFNLPTATSSTATTRNG